MRLGENKRPLPDFPYRVMCELLHQGSQRMQCSDPRRDTYPEVQLTARVVALSFALQARLFAQTHEYAAG